MPLVAQYGAAGQPGQPGVAAGAGANAYAYAPNGGGLDPVSTAKAKGGAGGGYGVGPLGDPGGAGGGALANAVGQSGANAYATGGAGGAGGTPFTAGYALGGAGGNAAAAAVALYSRRARAVTKAVGGQGGFGAFSGSGPTGGVGGSVTSASAAATSTPIGQGLSRAQAYVTAQGGAGGGAGGAGGSVDGAHTTATAVIGVAYARTDVTGGTGGGPGLLGPVGGAGGAVSGSSAAAYGGVDATAIVSQTGGSGGYGIGEAQTHGASGLIAGDGASSSLTNAVRGTASGGFLYLTQTAKGGHGGEGYGQHPGGAGGEATSSLTVNDTTASRVAGSASAIGGGGGYDAGFDGVGGGAGGAGAASINVTGAHLVGANAYAVGGGGGRLAFFLGTGLVPAAGTDGTSATASATASSTTSGAEDAGAQANATGGAGGAGGNGGAGASITGVTATAMESKATGGMARAYASGIGGAGGAGYITGGAGGVASGTTAQASGFSAYAMARQVGGNGGSGGIGPGGGGGNGASSTLINAVSGTTRGGDLKLVQLAKGGAGGSGAGGSIGGGAGSTGGTATSILTVTDLTARSIVGTVSAYGGARGDGSGPLGAGHTGNGSASITLVGANTVSATAQGFGGQGDATASATTDGGHLAKATAVGGGGGGAAGGAAQATATTNALGPVTNVVASSHSDIGQNAEQTSLSETQGGDVDQTAPAGTDSYALASLDPNASFISTALSSHGGVQGALGGLSATVYGAASLGAGYFIHPTGVYDYKSSVDFTLNTTTLSGELVLGLLDANSTGAGFKTLEMKVTVGGVTKVDQAFTSLSAAQAYFTDDAVDLGALPSSPNLHVVISFDVTVDARGEGFGANFLIGKGGVAAGETLILTPHPDTLNGGGGVNTVIAAGATLSLGDVINAGSGGANTLALQGGGTFDLRAPTTLTGVTSVAAQEGQAAYGNFIPNTEQTIYLRTGTHFAVDVAANAAPDAADPFPSGIVIRGADNADVVNLGAGDDTVFVGGNNETINGGSGFDIFYETAASAGATLHGGSGRSLLILTGGGAVSLGAGAGVKELDLHAQPPGQIQPAWNVTVSGLQGLTISDDGAAADTLNLGSGAYTVKVTNAAETVRGGAGAYTVYETAATAGATIDGGTGSSLLILTGGGVVDLVNASHLKQVILHGPASGQSQPAWTFAADSLQNLTIIDDAGQDTITLAAGDVLKATAARLDGGSVNHFAAGEKLDVIDQTGGALAFAEDASNTFGTLTVGSGPSAARIVLFGQFQSSGFQATSDGGAGEFITYTPPPSPFAIAGH